MPTKTIEITVSATGKIPRRNFENYAPMFVVKEVIDCGVKPISDQKRIERQKEIYSQCEGLFSNIREQIQIEEIQEKFKNLRFTKNPEDGRSYPHVTDILYWDAEFYISPAELTQYAARGSAIHSMIDEYLRSNKWDISAIHKRDLIILKTGELRLFDTLGDINFLGFMEKYGNDIKFGDGEYLAFNQHLLYCGRPDRDGLYQGRPAIFDFKCREGKEDDFKQMAMYLHLDHPNLTKILEEKGVMVVIPLNSQNKQGFGKPMVSDEIEKYFNLALRDRQEYKEKFGI